MNRLQNVIDKSGLGIIAPSLLQVEAEKVLYACVVKAGPHFEKKHIQTRAYLDTSDTVSRTATRNR